MPAAKSNKNNGSSKVAGKQVAATAAPRPILDLARLRRADKPDDNEEENIVQEARPVSNGPVDKLLDVMFNPSRLAIRGVTVIDRFQGRMFPQMDMCGAMMRYVMEVALYREDAVRYEKRFGRKHPIQPDLHDEFLFSTALWNRSVAGKAFDAGISLTQAQVEGQAEDDGMEGHGDPYAKED